MVKIFPIINIKKFSFKLRKRTRNNNDAVICIYGDEGIGKSTFGIILAILIMNNKSFSFIDNVAWTSNPEEIINKVKKMPKGSVLLLDEAIKFLEKQEWRKSTYIKKLFNVIRGRNLITLLVLPRLIDLTEYFRNHRVLISLYCHWRGFAVLTMKSRIPNVLDPFSIKVNNAIMSKYMDSDESVDDVTIMQGMQEMKGFKGFITYPDLPQSIYDLYEKFKLHFDLLNLGEEDEDENDKKTEQIILLAKCIIALKDSGLTIQQISEKLDCNTNKVKHYLYTFKNDKRMKVKTK